MADRHVWDVDVVVRVRIDTDRPPTLEQMRTLESRVLDGVACAKTGVGVVAGDSLVYGYQDLDSGRKVMARSVVRRER